MTELRSLLFPLGYIASLLFFLRFYIQWFKSERIKKSHITPSFWIFSLLANVAMALHGLIQSQFPICLIQSTNAIISWRNLDLMKKGSARLKRSQVIIMMALTILIIPILFFILGPFEWMRSPTHQELSIIWHFFGFLGMTLFASRFWVQWIMAEKEKESRLNPSFWKISLLGGLFTLAYCIRLQDSVQTLSFACGLLPYIRNLVLLKKQTHKELTKDSLFFVAGETSGDLLGQELIEELKKQSPNLTLTGVGGSLMEKAGMTKILGLEALNVMGFSDVMMALPRLYKSYKHIKRTLLNLNPEKVILIDYQDFNMFLAKSLRKSGYQGQIIQYVSPSVWAWRKKRMYKMAKTHDLLLSIFPFEKPYYAKTSLPVEYVGHPLVTSIQNATYATSWKESKGLKFGQKILTLFPGSRPHEVKRNLSIHLEVAKKWLSIHEDFALAISVAREDLTQIILSELAKHNLYAALIPFSERYELMKATDLAMATSGTVTLELALHNVPAVITYLLSSFNYFLGRYIFRIKLPYYCIVNIIGGKEIYPEFIEKRLDPKDILNTLSKIYKNEVHLREDLSRISSLMGSYKASQKAATSILAYFGT